VKKKNESAGETSNIKDEVSSNICARAISTVTEQLDNATTADLMALSTNLTTRGRSNGSKTWAIFESVSIQLTVYTGKSNLLEAEANG